MDSTAFISRESGAIVKISDGRDAFVPAPLPPRIEASWNLTGRLSEAERAVGQLAGIGRTLPNPQLLIRPFLNREAVLSSRIEGTYASVGELLLFEAAGSPEAEPGDVREVANYVHALRYGLSRLDSLPLSLRFLREIHAILMKGVRGDTRAPGEYRQVQNWIGGRTLADATYVPPPVPEMHAALDRLERYLHDHSDLPLLIRAALIHYQFEAIHPFLDGNGRVGRLLIVFLLHVHNLLDQPLLYLSAFFERNRQEYYSGLLAVSQRGAWSEWVEFFLTGVAQQADDAVARSGRLLDLRNRYHGAIGKARNSALLGRIVDQLFAAPATTIADLAKHLRISYPASKNNVLKLVEAGILSRPPEGGRNRFYIAREIVAIAED
jgi:Fic family protein